LSAEGQQVFLQALDCWLTEDGANCQRTARRYPLAHFVTSGKFEYYIPRVQELAEQSSRAAVEVERQRGDAEIARRRQAIKEQLLREEDVVGVEFADWQSKSGSADGFVPSDAPAFERYVARERLQQWTAESGESLADLDSQRRSVIGAAIEARLAEATQ